MGLSNLILELVAWVSILLVQVALLCLMHHGILATMFKLFAGNLWILNHISLNNSRGGLLFFFAQKPGEYSREAIISEGEIKIVFTIGNFVLNTLTLKFSALVCLCMHV